MECLIGGYFGRSTGTIMGSDFVPKSLPIYRWDLLPIHGHLQTSHPMRVNPKLVELVILCNRLLLLKQGSRERDGGRSTGRKVMWDKLGAASRFKSEGEKQS